MNGSIKRNIVHVESGKRQNIDDFISVEEPLEIKIYDGKETYNVSVIMRTPVDDFALAAGFLFTEGIVKPEAITGISYSSDAGKSEKNNIVIVSVKSFEREMIGNRNFYVNSSCGVCGKTNINDIYLKAAHLINHSNIIDYNQLLKFPGIMGSNQDIFVNTGGVHAAAIIDYAGNLLSIGEDIGRHNAVDKAIGKMLLKGIKRSPEAVLQVSGRAGFEIVQKAAMYGIPVVSSVSAPSSLAIELADEFNMLLVSFVRGKSFNIYAHPEWINIYE
jgi:FdhD protein